MNNLIFLPKRGIEELLRQPRDQNMLVLCTNYSVLLWTPSASLRYSFFKPSTRRPQFSYFALIFMFRILLFWASNASFINWCFRATLAPKVMFRASYSPVSKPFIIVTQLLSSFALSIESLIWSFMSWVFFRSEHMISDGTDQHVYKIPIFPASL